MPSGKRFVIGAIDGKQISADVPLVAEFLEHLLQRTPPLAIDTIRGYRSALSSTLYNVVDLKTVFLLKLASGRHRNELHAISCDEKCYHFRADGGLVTLITEPGFLAKIQKPQDSTPWIVIPGLGPSVGDHPNRKLCPVRALKAYLERTKELEVRRGRTRLFLNPKKPESDISPVHISIWIKKLVQDAPEHAGVEQFRLAKVSAHDVRKFSASWAAFNSAPFDEIIQAAYWKSQTTITSFYLKAMATQAEGLFALGPIVAGQTVIQPPGTSSDEEEAYTLLSPSSHPKIESADSRQLFMK